MPIQIRFLSSVNIHETAAFGNVSRCLSNGKSSVRPALRRCISVAFVGSYKRIPSQSEPIHHLFWSSQSKNMGRSLLSSSVRTGFCPLSSWTLYPSNRQMPCAVANQIKPLLSSLIWRTSPLGKPSAVVKR